MADEETNTESGAKNLLGHDWADEVMGRIDGVVDTIHDKAITPIMTVVRAMVFGIVIALMVTAAVILLSMALVRILNNYVTGHTIWITYAILCVVFFVIGLVLWSQRKVKAKGA